MNDQKKYTLEDDLRSAAHALQVAANQDRRLREHREDLSRRLYKWADGRDPNEPDVDLRGIKVGDEVTFEGGGVEEVLYVNRESSERTAVGVESSRWGLLYHHNGMCVGEVRPNIISYRTPPFDFQRSYDRGVRRFKKRDGTLTTELYWFKESESPHPVRDSYGCAWSSRGLRYQGMEGHPADLIAEAPADVQPEDV